MNTERQTKPVLIPQQKPPALVSFADLPKALRWFVYASLVLTIASLLHALICRKLGYGLPYSFAYYYIPGDRFSDFRGFVDKFSDFGRFEFYTTHKGYFMYPVPLVFVFALFFKAGHAVFGFLIFLLASCAFLIWSFSRILQRAGASGEALWLFVSATVLLSYPLLFEVMRGNIEVLIWLLTSVGIWAFWRKNPTLAAVCFGLATACKFFPLIFFGLLFAQRKYKEMLLGVAVAAGVTLIALYFLGPTVPLAFAWDNLQMATFRNHFAGLPNALAYDHSFFGLIKGVTLPWHPDLQPWVQTYTRASGVLGLLLYFGLIWRKPVLNQILAISILAVTLTPVSFDYTLLSLYPIFAILCCVLLRDKRLQFRPAPDLRLHMLLFSVVFTPLSFFVWAGGRYSGQFRCIALICLLVLSLTRPILDREDGLARA